MATTIKHGKHKGQGLAEVVKMDPNYALYASLTYAWFPKLTDEQIKDCQNRYRHKPNMDWATYDMADYGEDWI